MAVKQIINGQHKGFKSFYYIKDGKKKLLKSIYHYINGEMIPLYKSVGDSNFITKDNKIFITSDNYVFNAKHK